MMATNQGEFVIEAIELQSAKRSATTATPMDSVENFEQSSKSRLTAQPSKEEETDNLPFYLRIVKWISLVFIAISVCVGAVLSKVSLVSITGRMFDLTSDPDGNTVPRSLLFVQLTLLLVIPEIVSFMRCLVWGVIGKTTKRFPWPSRAALIRAIITSVVEVFTLCGFVFGAACKLPPSLTILILNGCFCFPIGCYLVYQLNVKQIRERIFNHQPHLGGYHMIKKETVETVQHSKETMEAVQQSSSSIEREIEHAPNRHGLKYLITTSELLGFLMQLGALVSIPILLSNEQFFSPSGRAKRYVIATYIIIPVSLSIISMIWSGWIQNITIRSPDAATQSLIHEKDKKARLKTGLIGSTIRMLLIPFVSYGYAVLLLDLKVDLRSSSFDWDDLELSTFLTHITVSYLTYLLAWIACALQSWAFLVPMLLSTPISFIWYVGSVEINEIFPFVDEYFVEWNLHYLVFIIASLLWVSQFLAFGYHIFQNSDNVLTNDSDLFWMPRYNSIFLEQQLILNRKTAISGYIVDEANKTVVKKIFSKNNFIFICSTMYNESEEEMRQLLQSIRKVAKAAIQNYDKRKNKFESHIFFDNACSGEEINQRPLVLLGLLEDTLGICEVSSIKIITPYGMQLKYKLKEGMEFYVHLKDNSKVKNKKRWSQVMYMNYILNHRIKQSKKSKDEKNRILKDKAFILTTDADIKFTSGSVTALLDILARDNGVGAVCARTHPLGKGPVVWYQVFDYAIGHWFQKAAEHILGCVLCCPGCFSVFRVSALEEVLDMYSSKVEGGFDFLTKDMGEDRWLCTLLIQKGWRLEYSAVSQDSTFCPESFDEFYKQRRRWIPSTIANLAEVIGSYKEITKNNSITILFILYEFLIVFSSLISPATVILIIVTGIRAIDPNANEIILIVVLSIISVLYGVICIYATEKIQLDVAKLLTLVFSIIMAVVISGIVSDIINDVISHGKETGNTNQTSQDFQFPIDITAAYGGLFAVTFVVAGILHFNEFFYLFHFIWYLLCLPSGYLFLIIYSACNINNRSWGTREETKSKGSSNTESWLDYFLGKCHNFLGFLNKCVKKQHDTKATNTTEDFMMDINDDSTNRSSIPHSKELDTEQELDADVKEWLKEHKCFKYYAENFKKEGYTKKIFIATMRKEDFKAIGIDKKGFQLKLEKEAKMLQSTKFKIDVPGDVSQWLESLELPEYGELFESEGYFSGEDVENLKALTKEDLQKMGITKRAHLNQLLTGLRYLQNPTDADTRINSTRSLMESVTKLELHEDIDVGNEHKFWANLAKGTLKPESVNLSNVDDLKQKLKTLRNLSVLILFLINVMWIVFLYTLVFPELTKYNLPDRAFSLLFLFVFSIILLIQFLAMVIHRFKTLLHLLAGIRSKDSNVEQWVGEDVEDVTKCVDN